MIRSETRKMLLAVRPAAFSYDCENKTFSNNGAVYPVSDIPLSSNNLIADYEPSELPNAAVVQTTLGAVAMPRLYDWLYANESDEMLSETADIMHDVYTMLVPHSRNIPRTYDASGLFGFNMSRARANHPHFTLTTIGSCACYGIERHGVFGEQYWDEKIGRMSFHNIDTAPQMISLMAGLGHLAHRANQTM